LRYLVLLVIAAGFAFAGRDSADHLIRAFSGTSVGGSATLDAWIDPPGYTGQPPVYLRASGPSRSVPTGSILNLRVHGASHAPGLSVSGLHAEFTGDNGEYASSLRITEDTSVRVRASGQALGRWSLHAIPDIPPRIAFDAPPGKTEHGALKLSFHAQDDY